MPSRCRCRPSGLRAAPKTAESVLGAIDGRGADGTVDPRGSLEFVVAQFHHASRVGWSECKLLGAETGSVRRIFPSADDIDVRHGRSSLNRFFLLLGPDRV